MNSLNNSHKRNFKWFIFNYPFVPVYKRVANQTFIINSSKNQFRINYETLYSKDNLKYVHKYKLIIIIINSLYSYMKFILLYNIFLYLLAVY